MLDHADSEDWIELIDRGGLTRINEIAFQVFLAVEIELRKYLNFQCVPNFKMDITKKVLENDPYSCLSLDPLQMNSQPVELACSSETLACWDCHVSHHAATDTQRSFPRDPVRSFD